MRLWSLHPQYLDTKGLLALWRESLLAQKVLQGKTKGYRNHPQLDRFKKHSFPQKAIGRYLFAIWEEANQRGYSFDKSKVKNARKPVTTIKVASGQIKHEWKHLRKKLMSRDPQRLKLYDKVRSPKTHSSFRKVPGPIALWEKV
ncbi:MAG TPA: pyrimidine dimer DNA glycosylase/endonuclease V [bacterium]|nr:pyrimidine dimer DNA glycosylase/endonuclease V [bacterium]